MTWTSRIPEVIQRIEIAAQEGIEAAGDIYMSNIQAALAQGYTTGEHVTGEAANSVTINVSPHHVSIGSSLDYVFDYEVGFHERGTGHFIREEKWAPIFVDIVDEMKEVIRIHIQQSIE